MYTNFTLCRQSKFIIIAALLMFFNSSLTYSQVTTISGEEIIYQDWQMLGESEHLLDVSAKVVSCAGVNQILLNVFNENSIDQQAMFTLTITNTNGDKLDTQFDFAINKAQMNIASCGDSTYDNLKIKLPAGFDPSTVKLSVTYNTK